jgi:D,D-heptose 1,7-bisphosphate phosphatase
VLYGDVVIDMDISKLVKFHKEKNSQATLVVHPNDHPYDSDLLELNQFAQVIAFHPKPHEANRYYRNMVNAAVYLFSPAIFPFLEKDKKADFGKDIFPKIIEPLKVFGYNTTEYIKDMGTPDRLDKVSHDLLSGKVQRRNLALPQKAIFLDRDGVINLDKGLICHESDFELYAETAEAVRLINQSDFIAIVVTNQPGIAKGMYDFDGLEEIHRKMDSLLGEERAKLDALYFCPHHPEKGFAGERPEYKIACDCRKPAAGMLLQAANDFNIDLSQSFIIGDHERDIVAGKTAGCTTIGVDTGHGLENTKTEADFRAANILEAVKLIMGLDD